MDYWSFTANIGSIWGIGASKFKEVFSAMEVSGGSSETPETATGPSGE